ncbi:c-type cytochrome [bacterium]|nr:c-type cytochrome [bacterium]
MRRYVLALWVTLASGLWGDIPKPGDAPVPLSPEESAKRVTLPPGFRLELVASEPLIAEPSGVAFDEFGRMFVTELHGYNLEGQLDVDELNKTGELDKEVRRIQADEKFKRAAEAGTYGTVKRLIDDNGDGRMDRAEVWADHLPPCYGLCPARGGVIVACSPDIRFLADNDGDGKAEINVVLYTGFPTGALERGINSPQWGLDDWIYVGGGHGGGTITGPHLKEPVKLPNSDFRIRADGSAIEPIAGKTHTYGFAFTAGGERFTISTRTAGIQVAPIDWRYLARNPDMPTGRIDRDSSPDVRVYPTSKPHPWRTRRAEDPGFSKFYSDRYGSEESSPNGYFTSACSPIVYLDSALPGLHGQLLACEPAQNLIHRAIIKRDGLNLSLVRPESEQTSEFLASSDAWFHPMSLSHGPDGAVWIVDFYREIIEDYSAIPRYLQQEYGVVNGRDRGRVWRLVHQEMPKATSAVMDKLSPEQLTKELESDLSWRRRTAQRLLVEREAKSESARLKKVVRESKNESAVVAAFLILKSLDELDSATLIQAMQNSSPIVQGQALKLADQELSNSRELAEHLLTMKLPTDPVVILQYTLSLGEIDDPKVTAKLATIARQHGDWPFLQTALSSSLHHRAGAMLAELIHSDAKIDEARGLLPALGAGIASRRDASEVSQAIESIASCKDQSLAAEALRGLVEGFHSPVKFEISESAFESVKTLLVSRDRRIQTLSRQLVARLSLESKEERTARLAHAEKQARDVQLPLEERLRGIHELAAEEDSTVAKTLAGLYAESTPAAQEVILSSLFAKKSWLPVVVEAMEMQQVPPSALSAVHRTQLDELKDKSVRERALALLTKNSSGREDVFKRCIDAIKKPRDLARGEFIFREKCGNCHQVRGIGSVVGPDLASEFQRAEETIIRDVVYPSEKIAAGYSTCVISTEDGRVHNGLLVAESAASLTLRQPGGKEETVLRKEIEEIKTLPVSLMPEDLVNAIEPADLANVIAWLRQPSESITLLDDNVNLAALLTQGDGTAEFVSTDHVAGLMALRVTPFQRHSPSIPNWSFRIRENPGPGEFRYLRFAWKSDGASGVMLELATDGHWPKADKPIGRYVAGKNETAWQATVVDENAPAEWKYVVRDLWKDLGNTTLTGIAPTAMSGPVLFDRMELWRTEPK